MNQQKRIQSNNDNNSDINMFKAPKENRRVYAGKRKSGENGPQVPRLFDICIRLLINNIDGNLGELNILDNIDFYSNRRNRRFNI